MAVGRGSETGGFPSVQGSSSLVSYTVGEA